MARLLGNEVDVHRARLTDVVTSVSASLKVELQSTVELLRAAEQGDLVSSANPETSGTPFSMPLVTSTG